MWSGTTWGLTYIQCIWPSLQEYPIPLFPSCFLKETKGNISSFLPTRTDSIIGLWTTCTHKQINTFRNKGINTDGYYFNIWRRKDNQLRRENVLKYKGGRMKHVLKPTKILVNWNSKTVKWQCLKDGWKDVPRSPFICIYYFILFWFAYTVHLVQKCAVGNYSTELRF